MRTWAVVVAAGQGTRFGGPKQLSPLAGKSVLAWSVAAAAVHADGVVIVVPEGDVGDRVAAAAAAAVPGAEVRTALGGPTRSASVRTALAEVPADAEVIVVHDAARPLAGPDLFERTVAAVRAGAAAAICAVPVTDTIKQVDGDRVVTTVPRDNLVAVQTPQAFEAAALRAAHAAGVNATDDAGLIEAAGGTVVVVPGSPENRKITEPLDLHIAEAMLSGPTR